MPVKRIYIATLLLYASVFAACAGDNQNLAQNSEDANDESKIAAAFTTRTSNIQVHGQGVVTRLLADDRSGSRHQRFIVRLGSGQTLLIAHNVDIAHRIDDLRTGDHIQFYGEYVWNAEGGTIHWTHHDPAGSHVTGWLKHNGQTYQ
ncbi:MAG TPA: DUF3465 domain-containing protein [Pyrinomonadaceae bacterium]|nr:DUF3465 domain-containing protein [Pyrinomonadaceae bacterium]